MRVEKIIEKKEPEKFIPDQPLGKVIGLIVVSTAASLLFWYAWRHALTVGVDFSFGSRNIATIVGTLGAFCLMLACFALVAMLVRRWYVVAAAAILAAASSFVLFSISFWSAVGTVVAVLALLAWRREMHADLESRTKFMPRRSLSAGITTTVALLLVAVSFVYYSYMTTRPDASQKLIDSLADTGTAGVQAVLKGYFRDSYRPTMTLDEFVWQVTLKGVEKITEQVKTQTGQAQVDAVIQQSLTAAEKQLVVEAREDLLQTLQIEATGDEQMESVVRKLVLKNLTKYTDRIQKYIPAILALGVFLLLRVFSFIYCEIAKSFGFLVFQALVWTNFIHVKKVQVEAEKISL